MVNGKEDADLTHKEEGKCEWVNERRHWRYALRESNSIHSGLDGLRGDVRGKVLSFSSLQEEVEFKLTRKNKKPLTMEKKPCIWCPNSRITRTT